MNWKKKLTTYTILTLLSTGIIHIINRFVYFIATIDNLLSKDEGEYYDWRFGSIYYTKHGEGSPILLIHDLNCCSSGYEWNKMVYNLSKTNTVYVLDLLGCGRSDKPNLTYTNFLYVQLITDFIKHVIEYKTDIIASGDAGSFALMACANDSSIIDKVMLVNPTSPVELAKIPTKRTKVVKYLINTPIIGTLLYNILVNKKAIDKNFRSDYYYFKNKVDNKDINAYFESAHKNNTHSKYLFASIKSRYTNANVMHCLQNIDNSIFIIVGTGNPENLLAANQYHNLLPSIEVIEMDETKLLPHMESPKDFLNQVCILFEI